MANPLILVLRGIRETGLRPTWDGLVYALRTRWAEARFADPERPLRGLPLFLAFLHRLPIPPDAFPPAGPLSTTPGPLHSYARRGQGLTITFAHATLTITVLAPDLIRVLAHPTNQPTARPTDPQLASPFDVTETPEAVQVHTERLVCHIARADGQVTFLDREGRLIAGDAAPVGWTADARVVCRLQIPASACFYGLGQRTTGLDRRGGSYVNWNTDPRTYGPGDDPVNLCLPFFLALHSGGRQGYGFLLENTARSRFDLGQSDPETLIIEVEDETLAYEFFYGPALTTVLERYTERTGRTPLFPLWALGYHQSRWSYFPEERVRRLAHDFREIHHVPCDAIHLDIHYMDGYRCFTWDRERFPDPARLIADLHAQGFKVVTIIDPGVKADRRYGIFQDGLERAAFCRYPDGRLFIGPVWPGNCAFPDFTDPRVREWWGGLHRSLVDAGVDGIWDDMNEPSLFGEDGATIPGPVCHDLDGEGGDHRRAHNVYGLSMARATAEGLARLAPARRPFVLTRSGWAGSQRFAAHWTGDNRSTWESLRLTLPMVLGLGLSGIAFTGADVGGFAGFPSGELFVRWLQLGIFFPFLRAHTVFDSHDQEPWSWGEPYLSINRETIRLRYRLLPYLYTALWQCTQSGMPIARPLLLAFQDDPATFALEDQFLCGDALLVAPVLEAGATKRTVYLPAGTWYDFWSDALYEGAANVEAAAPLERIPLFVRAGSVVPMVFVGQDDIPLHTEALLQARPAEPLTLHVYPPAGSGQCAGERDSWLYEDDGESMAYRRGEYRLTRFILSTSEARLDLAREVEGSFDPGYDRFQVIVHGIEETPSAVEGMPGAEITYASRSHAVRVSGGPFTTLSLRW